MGVDKNKIIRIIIFLIGVLYIYFSILEFVNIFSGFLNLFLNLGLEEDSGSFTLMIIYCIFGYLFILVSVYKKKVFKQFARGLVGVSIFFVSLGFMLFSLNTYSVEVVDSVQPSIDLLVVSLFDSLLDENIQIRDGESIDLILSTNAREEKLFVSNLTISQADYLTEKLSLGDISDEKKLSITKLFITLGYEQIGKTEGMNNDVAVPVNQLKSQIGAMGVDINILRAIDENLISQMFPFNEDAFLVILKSESDESVSVEIGNLNDDLIIKIWQNLGLSQNVSMNSKEKIINIFLSYLKDELTKQETGIIELKAVPLATLKTIIPQDFIRILNYDILNENISFRVSEFNKIVQDCSEGRIVLKEICDGISVTQYSYFMTNIGNLSAQANISIPVQYLGYFEKVNSLEKLNEQVNMVSSYYNLCIVLIIIFMFLAVLSYYVYMRINYNYYLFVDIFYYIIKFNLQNFGFFLGFLIMGVLFINSNYFFNFLTVGFSGVSDVILNIFLNLPMFNVLNIILNKIIILSCIYFGVSLLLFLGFYFYKNK